MAESSSSPQVDLICVTILLTDGTELARLRLSPEKTIGLIRRRAAPNSSSKLVLCCDGTLLSDSVLVRELRSLTRFARDNEICLTAWYPRYSQEKSSATAASRAGALLLDRRQLWRYARVAARFLAAVLRMIPLGTWVRLLVWLALFCAVCHVELGGPFLVASAMWFVWHVGFSDGNINGVSAYTVFNRDMAALPGQLMAEEVQRNVVGL